MEVTDDEVVGPDVAARGRCRWTAVTRMEFLES
jgi:hypothetical protein